jgi:hypothetical protein
MFVLEPEAVHDYGPPMFLNLEDIIHHNHPGLSYPIQVDIVEIEDWNDLSDSSDDRLFEPQRSC